MSSAQQTSPGRLIGLSSDVSRRGSTSRYRTSERELRCSGSIHTPLKTDSELKIDDLSRMTDGYSGSDIRDICQSVQLRVVGELFDEAGSENKEVQPRAIDVNDFREVLKLRKPSVSPQMLKAYAEWAENFKAL